jgi:outer membrane protein OmpA-like peptidoglycan-associated protein
MPTVTARRTLAAVALSTLFASVAAAKDVPGAKDSPLVTRFPGSSLVGYFQKDWDQTQFPTGPGVDHDNRLEKGVTVEGKITRLYYLGPVGKTPLEVFRSYQQAFAAAGLKVKYACELKCETLAFHWTFGAARETARWADVSLRSTRADRSWNVQDLISNEDGRGVYGTLTSGGREVHVWVYTSIAGYAETDASGTVIEIAEPKAMASGQVTVDAGALGKGLAADGRVALYGIYFDTGKATLKAESDAQLTEMARLLTSPGAPGVLIVGHTDNQGSFENNVELSKLRAAAVRDALVTRFKVPTNRLLPYGVGSAAPVASNADEAGRARNRRVELVVR